MKVWGSYYHLEKKEWISEEIEIEKIVLFGVHNSQVFWKNGNFRKLAREHFFTTLDLTTHKRQYYHSSQYNTKKLKANGKWTCTKTTKAEQVYKKNRGLKTYKLIDWTYSKINENEA